MLGNISTAVSSSIHSLASEGAKPYGTYSSVSPAKIRTPGRRGSGRSPHRQTPEHVAHTLKEAVADYVEEERAVEDTVPEPRDDSHGAQTRSRPSHLHDEEISQVVWDEESEGQVSLSYQPGVGEPTTTACQWLAPAGGSSGWWFEATILAHGSEEPGIGVGLSPELDSELLKESQPGW